jgi:hypothetical protein
VLQLRIAFGSFILLELVAFAREPREPEYLAVGADEVWPQFGFAPTDEPSDEPMEY